MPGRSPTVGLTCPSAILTPVRVGGLFDPADVEVVRLPHQVRSELAVANDLPEQTLEIVARLVERPVVKNSQIVVRKMMNLSSSFDHRVVDGYDAAAFIQRVKGMLEHPAALFM